MENTDSTLT